MLSPSHRTVSICVLDSTFSLAQSTFQLFFNKPKNSNILTYFKQYSFTHVEAKVFNLIFPRLIFYFDTLQNFKIFVSKFYSFSIIFFIFLCFFNSDRYFMLSNAV